MILDCLAHKEFYMNENDAFGKAFVFLENFLNSPLRDGCYEIAGDEIFAVVQSYRTKNEGVFEAHNQYIDIQFMAEGYEKIEYRCRDGLEIAEEYAEDVVFLKDVDKSSSLILREKSFAIFFPQDAHKPCLMVDEPQNVKKIVVKIRIR